MEGYDFFFAGLFQTWQGAAILLVFFSMPVLLHAYKKKLEPSRRKAAIQAFQISWLIAPGLFLAPEALWFAPASVNILFAFSIQFILGGIELLINLPTFLIVWGIFFSIFDRSFKHIQKNSI